MVNKLVSIVTDADKKWVRHFPPMPTKRHSTAAVTTNQHLIVAGGERRSVLTNTVEVMDIQTLVWSTLTPRHQQPSVGTTYTCWEEQTWMVPQNHC